MLSSKSHLEATPQQEQDVCRALCNDSEENKDRRGLIQRDLEATEKKLTQQGDVAWVAE